MTLWHWYTDTTTHPVAPPPYTEAYAYWINEWVTDSVTKLAVEERMLYGSLVLRYDSKNRLPLLIGHYFMTADALWTSGFSSEDCAHVRDKDYATPLEAFYELLARQLNRYFPDIDDYEERMMLVQREMVGVVSPDFMEEVFQLRNEIERWSDTIVPYKELLLAGKEAFVDESLERLPSYVLLSRRLERALMLVEHYQSDVVAMIDLASTLSNFRGNEIMKALTIFTALTTPVFGFGALWGMNFVDMPELKWRFGYVFAWAVIAVFTLLIYIWLKRRNWIGSLLKFPKSQVKKGTKVRYNREKRNEKRERI